MPSSPDTLQMLLYWTSSFLQPEWNLYKPSGYCILIDYVFTFRTTNVFGCLRGVMAQFELVNHNFDNVKPLSVQLSNHSLSETIHYASAP